MGASGALPHEIKGPHGNVRAFLFQPTDFCGSRFIGDCY